MSTFIHGIAALAIVSAMLTPAILILAAGSLTNSVLLRLGRMVDRTRQLIVDGDAYHRTGNAKAMAIIDERLKSQVRRAELARHASSRNVPAEMFTSITIAAVAKNRTIPPTMTISGPMNGCLSPKIK